MQSPTTTARRLSRTSIAALAASIFTALVLGLLGSAPAHADTGQDGDTWPTFVPGVTTARCAADGSEKVTLHIQKANDGRAVETDRFRYDLEDGQSLLLGDGDNSEYVLVGSDGQPVAVPIPSDNRLDYLVWWKDPSGVDQKVGIFYFTRFDTCGETESPDTDTDDPEPAPKQAAPKASVTGTAKVVSSPVSRGLCFGNTNDPTNKANDYTGTLTGSVKKTVRVSRLADAATRCVAVKLGAGTYYWSIVGSDGKSNTVKFTVGKWPAPTFKRTGKAYKVDFKAKAPYAAKIGYQTYKSGRWSATKWAKGGKTFAANTTVKVKTPNASKKKPKTARLVVDKTGEGYWTSRAIRSRR